jgi:hypothetical protein
MRRLFLVSVFLVGVSNLFSQSLSPLQQLMASSPLVARPKVFRDLQESIRTRVSQTKPGLHVEDFYKDAADAGARLLGFLHPPKVDLTRGKDSLILVYEDSLARIKATVAIPLKINVDKMRVDTLLTHVQEKLGGFIDTILTRNMLISEEEKDAMIAQLYNVLQTPGFGKDLPAPSTREEFRKNLSYVLAEAIVMELKKVIEREYPQIRVSEKYVDADTLKRYMQLALNKATDAIRTKVESLLNSVEHAVVGVIEEGSRWLLRGNAGIAVTKGEGAFAGGIYTAVVTTGFQAGVYFNGQFQGGESGSSAQSLVGLDLQVALSDRTQLEGLGSVTVSEVFKKSEWGLGILARDFWVFQNILLGGGVYHAWESAGPWAIGISVRSTATQSPTLFVGFSDVNKKPIVRLSFPVIPTK